ncbi:alkaline phosphatase D family protein [Streptomyces sp. NPDC056534]|uniref:alkaline phosphatase D family protein n=1 Tax=Streptomyces sp. NPDC056534 TaxID=3345857 RepID=UPI003694AAE5
MTETPENSTTPTRRTLVKAVAGTAFLPVVAAATSTQAAASTAAAPSFRHGVASGDPLPDGIVLWTRVTPVPDAAPGSGLGNATDVEWSVATDPRFTTAIASGVIRTGPQTDHTVKADVRGLKPATTYWYRFRVQGVESPVGRTRTAPAPHANVDQLRFGVVSCANWEAGYFSPYRHLVARGDLEAVLFLGDYIYEYATGEYSARDLVVRVHKPAHEIVSLADYRLRHGTYKTDPDLQALHASLPAIAIWDDHEFANNATPEGAENHQPLTEGTWSARMAAAKQAYFEWMPVRTSVAGTTYRWLRYGKLADIALLDLRSFRSAQGNWGPGGDVDDPDRTLTGRAQMDWLKSGLTRSDAAWRLIGNSVMMSPVKFLSLPAYLLRPLAKLLGLPQEGLAINTDQWDGYTADRRELLDHLKATRIEDTVFLTGDIHSAWASNIPVEAATYPLSKSVATEFVVASVTSDNIDDILKVAPHTVSLAATTALRAANRHLKWIDLDSHGFGVLDVTAERAQMDYYVVSDRTDPRATASWARSYRTLRGTQKLERVETPPR